MFGYVTINKPELKIREFSRYQSYYCGLCHVLSKRHGLKGQLTLTYDMTFLVILLSSLYEPETVRDSSRCPVHPMKKHPRSYNRITEYAADMNVLLAYYKCADDWNDDRSAKGLCSMRLLDRQVQQIMTRYPEKSRYIRRRLRQLARLEEQNCTEIDKAAGCFGRLMGVLFDYTPPAPGSASSSTPAVSGMWSRTLKRFGFYLGKYIYILDAFLDLKEDLQKGRYNPLSGLAADMDEASIRSDCRQILELTMGEACREFEKLPLVEDIELMRNILYAGVWKQFDEAEQDSAKRKDEK